MWVERCAGLNAKRVGDANSVTLAGIEACLSHGVCQFMDLLCDTQNRTNPFIDRAHHKNVIKHYALITHSLLVHMSTSTHTIQFNYDFYCTFICFYWAVIARIFANGSRNAPLPNLFLLARCFCQDWGWSPILASWIERPRRPTVSKQANALREKRTDRESA